ncbi:hypothetical protein DFH28DRAFT_883987, partial [Melampsora americana]
GELEITFVKSFCRAGNLAALLQDVDKLPEALRPYIDQLKALYEPTSPRPRRLSNSKFESLDEEDLACLIRRLNDQGTDECIWVSPREWVAFKEDEGLGKAPVPPRAQFYNKIEHNDVSFSVFEKNLNDSFVVFRSRSDGFDSFGRIAKIFVHRRSPETKKTIIQTWLRVQTFKPIQQSQYDPFKRLDMPDMNVHLRAWDDPEDRLVKLDEVVAHCSWLMYKPKLLHSDLKISTVALVSMVR